MIEFLRLTIITFLGSLPAILWWIAVLVIGIVLLNRKDDGRAEKFIIAGAGIRIAGQFLNIASTYFNFIFYAGDYTGWGILAYKFLLSILNTAGIICLIYAFWVKFNERQTQEISVNILEREKHD